MTCDQGIRSGPTARVGGAALAGLLLLLWIAGGSPSASAKEDAVDGALSEAAAHLEAGRAAAAVEVLEKAWATVEDAQAEVKSRVQAALGNALVAAGEPYAALQYLADVAEARGAPDDHLAYAEVLLAVGRENAARPGALGIDVKPYLEDALLVAARVEGEATQARRAWLEGEVHYWLGDPEAALGAWKGLPDGFLGDDPTSRYRHDLVGAALYRTGAHVDAAAAYERAGNLRGAASAWAAARQGRDAVEAYRRLLAQGEATALLADGRLLEEMLAAVRYSGAEAELAGLLADLPVKGQVLASVLAVRARLAALRGALDASETLLVRAAEADPTNADVLVELGRVRYQRVAPGDQDALDEALTTWIGALQTHSGDPADLADAPVVRLLWDLAGREYSAAWRSERSLARSLRIQEALVAADPEDGLAWANLGNTLRIAGRHEEACAAYDRAAELEAFDPGILSDRGLALSALGRTEEALAAFLRAAELEPESGAARQNAGRVHWLAGRDAESERLLAEAARSARRTGGNYMRYRFLLDRAYRTRVRPELR